MVGKLVKELGSCYTGMLRSILNVHSKQCVTNKELFRNRSTIIHNRERWTFSVCWFMFINWGICIKTVSHDFKAWGNKESGRSALIRDIDRGGLEPPSVRGLLYLLMKWHFIQGSMESHHFESQSAPWASLQSPHFEKSYYAPGPIWYIGVLMQSIGLDVSNVMTVT